MPGCVGWLCMAFSVSPGCNTGGDLQFVACSLRLHLCHRHDVEDALHHAVLIDTGGFGFKRQNDAVA